MGRFPRALLSLLLRYIGVIITIFLGSLIFTNIENVGLAEEITQLKEHMELKKIEKARVIREFERKLNVSINASVFDELVSSVHNLTTKTLPNKWDLATGTHYAFTIVSTIGKINTRFFL